MLTRKKPQMPLEKITCSLVIDPDQTRSLEG